MKLVKDIDIQEQDGHKTPDAVHTSKVKNKEEILNLKEKGTR